MAASGYSPIQLYYSTTASAAPTAGNLASGELAINITDGKLYYKDNAGAVQLLSTSTTANGTANGVLYLNGSKVATSGSALTFDGTNFVLASGGLLDIDGTSGSTALRIRQTTAGAGTEFNTTITENTGVTFDCTDGGITARSFIWTQVGSEQMRLTSTGLGIGTSSPGYKTVVSGGASDSVLAIHSATNTSPSAKLYLMRGTTSTFGGDGYTDWSVETTGADLTINSATSSVTSERLRIDSSGNLGLGVTPSASNLVTLQSTYGIFVGNSQSNITKNAYYNSGWKYVSSDTATQYQQASGEHRWLNATSGTAGNAITFTQAMTLDSSGRLFVGTTTLQSTFEVLTLAGSNSTANDITLYGPSTSQLRLQFSKSGAAGQGEVGYNMATDAMRFVTSGTERARIDSSGNLGLGVTPSAWTSLKVIQLGTTPSLSAGTNDVYLSSNSYFDGSWKYIGTSAATQYYQVSGTHVWRTAASGTAGNAITFTQAMTLDANGNLEIGLTSNYNSGKVEAAGAILSTAATLSTFNANNAGFDFNASTKEGRFFSTSANTTGGFMTFTTGQNGSYSERARIDFSGNLGIGTTSPSSYGKLAVGSTGSIAILGSTGSAGTTGRGLTLYNSTSTDGNNFAAASFKAAFSSSTYSSGYGYFETVDSSGTLQERARIDSSGNWMIGQTSATGKASVTGTGSGNTGILAITATDSSSTFIWGTQTFAASIPSGSNLIHMIGQSGSNKNAGYIGYKWSSSGSNSNLLTFGHYGSDNLMNLTADGNLLVGTTSDSLFADTGGFIVYPTSVGETYIAIKHDSGTTTGNSYATFVYGTGSIGSITQNGTTAVAYNTSSDYRLKDNQQPLTGSGAFIDALKPKTWNWKADGSRGVGFIAHEVQAVSPGSVTGEKDGEQMQAMEYGSAEFIANIIAELQSLRARVAQLESK